MSASKFYGSFYGTRKAAGRRTVKKLDEAALLSAEPRAKPYRIYGDGLFLIVNPNGAKWWRMSVRRNGINTCLSLGAFPQTSIADALAERDRIRAQARMGMHPAAARRAVRDGVALGSAGVAFSVALSADGALAATIGDQKMCLTRYQTDTIRSALLADR